VRPRTNSLHSVFQRWWERKSYRIEWWYHLAGLTTLIPVHIISASRARIVLSFTSVLPKVQLVTGHFMITNRRRTRAVASIFEHSENSFNWSPDLPVNMLSLIFIMKSVTDGTRFDLLILWDVQCETGKTFWCGQAQVKWLLWLVYVAINVWRVTLWLGYALCPSTSHGSHLQACSQNYQ
jgi:hypothetical protein